MNPEDREVLLASPFFSSEFATRLAHAANRHGRHAGAILSESFGRLVSDSVAAKFDPSKGSEIQWARGVMRKVSKEVRRKESKKVPNGRFVKERTEPDPLSRLVISETLDRTMEAVDRLKPRDREWFLARVEAKLQGIRLPRQTVAERSRLWRIRRELRKAVDSLP